jgi:SpoVK/Ycf46/Vps4 family AAA+-type ATPase
VVTVATTNDPSAVDAGIRRAARFDRIITFPLPDAPAREEILHVYLRSVDHSVDVPRIAMATEGKTGADLREFVRAALLGAVLHSSEKLQTEDLLHVVEDDRGQPPGSGTGFRIPPTVDYL